MFFGINFLLWLNQAKRMEDEMIGVVLWSDAADRKAVIWCEDQGDLAFVNAPDTVLESGGFFDAGDLVQFDLHVKDATRRAHNPRLVMEKAAAALPQILRDEVRHMTESTGAGAVVVPFRPAADRSLGTSAEEVGVGAFGQVAGG